jgi:hypothetical protein
MQRIPPEILDHILSIQFSLAWAGEEPEEPDERLGWWRTDLLHEDAGMPFLSEFLPRTARWGALVCAREAARRAELSLRKGSKDADKLQSIFTPGFDIEEQLNERLDEHRSSGKTPEQALPGLFPMTTPLDRAALTTWLKRGEAKFTPTPNGRRLNGAPPEGLKDTFDALASATHALPATWQAPHFRLA